MAFYVGQKVICVDDSPSWKRAVLPIVRGKIYTVAKIPDEERNGERGLLVAEVCADDQLPGFRQSRFKPAVERKTDISIFKKMLTPKKRELVHEQSYD